MALDTKLLTFTANTTTGDQDLTGTSFTPKAAIVWYQRSLNSVNTFTEHVNMGMSFTDGITTVCHFMTSEDNQTSSDSSMRNRNDGSIIVAPNPTGTVTTTDCVASFSTWLSNGMRINWSDAPADAFKIHILFLGGSDLTNVKVDTFTTNTSTGNQSVTGTGFQPDLVLFMGSRLSYSTTISSGASFGIGAAIDSSNRWAQSITIEDGRTTMDTWQIYDHTKCLIIQESSSGAVRHDADFVSQDSDGFTINFTTAFGFSSHCSYIAFKGGSYSIGNETEPGSTGNQTITTSKDVKAVMIFGLNTGTSGSEQPDCMLTIGGGTGSSEMVCGVLHDTDASADSICVGRYETDSIYLNMTANATTASSTIDDEASLNSVSSTNFVLNWSNIGNARPYRYIAFGDGAAVAEVVEEIIPRHFGNPNTGLINNVPQLGNTGVIFGY